MNYKPYDYQQYATNQVIQNPRYALILDMGLGKTVSTLAAMHSLMFDRFEVNRVLVIGPLNVVDVTWVEEMEKWDFAKDFRYVQITGDEKRRLRALEQDADVYLINRENVAWLIQHYVDKKKKMGKAGWKWDMIVIDEASSFKNPTSERFQALKVVAQMVPRIVELSGTPAPNGLLDLWSQVFLLDNGMRLGRTITEYRDEYFQPDQRSRTQIFSWKLKPRAEGKIYDAISDIAVSMKAVDYVKMPKRIDNIINIRLTDKEYAKYVEMETEYLVQLDESTVTAGSAGAVSTKLLQMANGAVYDTMHFAPELHTAKLRALLALIEASHGKNLLVLCAFDHDMERIEGFCHNYKPVRFQGMAQKKLWDSGEIRILLAHPASMGHGLNLQYGGNIIVWFGLTYNLEHYLQANARLYRQGQREESVIIHHLVVKGTRDEDAMERLAQKEVNQDKLIESIKAQIRSAKERLAWSISTRSTR